ncbi:MAG TPA: peptidoglycan binding domain-containing protein [Thermomicrobiales bacterium]|nr:peptidoglycan binding domain-containing protein [Thermomicrobiales bacterium]
MNSSALRVPALPWKRRRSDTGKRAQLLMIARVAQTALMIVTLLFVASVAGLALYGYTHANRIYEGVSVAGVPVGGLTPTEARLKVEQQFLNYVDTPITLIGGDEAYSMTPREAGMTLDSANSTQAAFNYGRDGSLWSRTREWVRAAISGRAVPAVASFDNDRLDARLDEIAGHVTRPPVNASVAMTAVDRPAIVTEQPGIAFDRTTTHARLVNRFLSLGADPVKMALPPVQPAVTVIDLRASLNDARVAVSAPLTITTGQKAWIVAPDELKRVVSVPSEDRALAVDRASLKGLIERIASELDRPSEDARLYITKDGKFKVAPAVEKVQVDVNASVDAAATALIAGSHDVDLVIHRQSPAISDEMALAAQNQAEKLVANGIKVQWADGSARLGRGDLMAAMTIKNHPGEKQPIVLGFDDTVLASLLDPIREKIDVPGKDAEFRLEDGKVKVVSKEQTGQAVDVDPAVSAISEAVLDHQPNVQLPIKTVKPKYTAADRSKIKVKDTLGEGSTYYGTSSDPRRRNVETAVRLETGWLIPPDGIFSYVKHIGGVTADQGFVTGYGIVADGAGGVTTAPVIGGGICQVSTTIFQAAYWAGLDVVERYTHPYWIESYGQPPHGMKGLDAMVNVEKDWSLDLKLKNTTGNWIAIVLRADGENVTADVVGTDPGWTVNVEQPTISNVITPPDDMIYTESPELPSGQELLVESAHDGFDASIHRVITKDGQVIDEDTISGTYAPSRNTTLRGTG